MTKFKRRGLTILCLVFIFCMGACVAGYWGAGRLEPGQTCTGGGPTGDVERVIGNPYLTLVPFGEMCEYTYVGEDVPVATTFRDLGTPYFLTGSSAIGLVVGMSVYPATQRARQRAALRAVRG